MPRPRVLLGDDHRMFSKGLQRLLEPQFEIIGISENGRDLIAAAERLRPDVIVADISMPSLNGIEAARRIRKMPHPAKVVFLTMHEDATFATAAFQAGALGYVLKRSEPAEILTAVQEAMRGRVYVSPLIAGDLLTTLTEKRKHPEKLKPELTSRQKEILQLFAEGKSPKEIAAVLNISVRTVEFHKYRIMEATGSRTIAELTRYAIAHGIIEAS
jgi:DNA-binding NarL/FixJ family response regulator